MALNFTFSDLIEITGGRALKGDAAIAAPEISTDSRTIQPGQWFLALRGENFDGHGFIAQALQKGAAGLIVAERIDESALDSCAAALWTPDTLQAYGDIARAWRRKIDPKVVCVAGSAGKTTTKEMAACVLASNPHALISKGNFNNLIGLPQTLLRLEPRHTLALVEIGMNMRGELRRLTRISDPDFAVLTNVGEAHVGRFGSMESLLEAKGELLAAMRPGSKLLANADCPRSAQVIERHGEHLDIVRFAMACWAPYRAESIERLEPTGYGFDFVYPESQQHMEVHAFGRANVANALCAAAMLFELGVDVEAIAEGIGRFRPQSLRSQTHQIGDITLIVDCYNASPAGMLQALESLDDLSPTGRIHLLLGDMLELGEDEESYHRQAGQAAAALANSRIYAAGPRARWIVEGATEAGGEASWFDSREAAAQETAAAAAPGDVILVKASRGMEFEAAARFLREKLSEKLGERG